MFFVKHKLKVVYKGKILHPPPPSPTDCDRHLGEARLQILPNKLAALFTDPAG